MTNQNTLPWYWISDYTIYCDKPEYIICWISDFLFNIFTWPTSNVAGKFWLDFLNRCSSLICFKETNFRSSLKQKFVQNVTTIESKHLFEGNVTIRWPLNTCEMNLQHTWPHDQTITYVYSFMHIPFSQLVCIHRSVEVLVGGILRTARISQRGGRTTEDRGMLGDMTMLGQCWDTF